MTHILDHSPFSWSIDYRGHWHAFAPHRNGCPMLRGSKRGHLLHGRSRLRRLLSSASRLPAFRSPRPALPILHFTFAGAAADSRLVSGASSTWNQSTTSRSTRSEIRCFRGTVPARLRPRLLFRQRKQAIFNRRKQLDGGRPRSRLPPFFLDLRVMTYSAYPIPSSRYVPAGTPIAPPDQVARPHSRQPERIHTALPAAIATYSFPSTAKTPSAQRKPRRPCGKCPRGFACRRVEGDEISLASP